MKNLFSTFKSFLRDNDVSKRTKAGEILVLASLCILMISFGSLLIIVFFLFTSSNNFQRASFFLPYILLSLVFSLLLLAISVLSIIKHEEVRMFMKKYEEKRAEK